MNFKRLFSRRAVQSNKINVGCGPVAREGWINIDIQNFPSVDRVMDVTKEWDFRDIDHIYAEHFLEHLELKSAIEFIYNAGQSLSTNGWLRLSTPNVEWVLKTHYKLHKNEDDADCLKNVTSINRAFYGWGHRFLFSEWLLTAILKEMGYTEIAFCNYGESDKSVFQGIEKHGGYFVAEGSPSVLIVEAKKDSEIVRPTKLLESLQEDFIRYSQAIG